MPSRRHMVLALLLCASAALLVYALRSSGPRSASKGGAESESQKPQLADAGPQAIASALPADVAFSRYDALTKSGLFGDRPQAPPPKAGGERKPARLERLPPLGAEAKPQAPAAASWSYLGYVALDGKKFGIVKNTGSDECRYLAEGEDFLGGKVEEIAREAIRVRTGSRQTSVSRVRDFSLTPLTRAGAGQPRQVRPE